MTKIKTAMQQSADGAVFFCFSWDTLFFPLLMVVLDFFVLVVIAIVQYVVIIMIAVVSTTLVAIKDETLGIGCATNNKSFEYIA